MSAQTITMSGPTDNKLDVTSSRSMSQISIDEIDSQTLLRLVQDTKRGVIEYLEMWLQKGGTRVDCESAASAISTLSELGRRIRQDAR